MPVVPLPLFAFISAGWYFLHSVLVLIAFSCVDVVFLFYSVYVLTSTSSVGFRIELIPSVGGALDQYRNFGVNNCLSDDVFSPRFETGFHIAQAGLQLPCSHG